MSRWLVIHEAAEAEINEAVDFYDIRIPDPGITQEPLILDMDNPGM